MFSHLFHTDDQNEEGCSGVRQSRVLIVALLLAVLSSTMLLGLGAAPAAAQSVESVGGGPIIGGGEESGAPPGDTASEDSSEESDESSDSSSESSGEGTSEESDGSSDGSGESSGEGDSGGSDESSDGSDESSGDGGTSQVTPTTAVTGDMQETPSQQADNSSSDGSGEQSGETTDEMPTEQNNSSPFSVNIDPMQLLALLFQPLFEFSRSVAQGILDMITERTYATSGGEFAPGAGGLMSGGDELDSSSMSLLHDWWWTYGLPTGLFVWLLSYVGLTIGMAAWPNSPRYKKMYAAKQEAPIKFFGIIFSWIIGNFIIFVYSAIIGLLGISGIQIIPDGVSALGNANAVGWGMLLTWLFGSIFLLGIAFSFFMAYICLYIMLPALPVLIAMSVPKFWFLEDLAETMEGLLEKFPTLVFYPLPAAVVLSVGYAWLNGMQNNLPGPAEWGTVGAYGIAVVCIWGLAFAATIYVFFIKKVSPMSGLVAGTMGAGAIAGALGKLGATGAGASAAAGSGAGAAGSAASSAASSASSAASNAINGSPFSSDSASSLGSGSGGSGLGSGSGGNLSTSASGGGGSPTGSGQSPPNSLPGGVGASMSGGGTTAGSSAGGSGVGASTASSAGSGGAAAADSSGLHNGQIPVSDPSVNTVSDPDNLPEQDYRAGFFNGSGESEHFTKVLDRPWSADDVQNNSTFARATEVRDEDIYVRGMDDGQYYDASPVMDSGSSGLGMSESEQTAESRSTVNDARGI